MKYEKAVAEKIEFDSSEVLTRGGGTFSWNVCFGEEGNTGNICWGDAPNRH